MRFKIAVFLLIVMCSVSLFGYEFSRIKPVRGFMENATIAENMYGEFHVALNSYDHFNTNFFWLQGGYPINEKLELGAALGFIYYVFEHDWIDDQSGLSDIRISAKYNFMNETTILTGGSYLTLPVGSEDVGQQNLNFGLWGSAHYPLNEKFDLISSLGLDFYETYTFEGKEEYDSALNIKLGALTFINEQLTLIPELDFRSEGDYGLLSAGADYLIINNGHLRGALGVGLDRGAPDLALQLGFLMDF